MGTTMIKKTERDSSMGEKKNNESRIILEPDRAMDEAISRKRQLEICLGGLEQQIQMAPEGSLRITSTAAWPQYYHRKNQHDRTGQYINASQRSLITGLAQKGYYMAVQREIERQLDVLNDFIKNYNPSRMLDIYENLSQQRKQLIYPVVMSDQEYAAWWLSQEYIGKEFRDNAPEYYTNAGERVRSKSEIIIADKLSKYGIPYRYEYPITTASGIVLHPDFYCLNVRSREEIILEHFGMMDDPDYAENAMKKIDLYHSEGFIQGKNLIATFESREKPLNVKLLEDSIRLYLL